MDPATPAATTPPISPISRIDDDLLVEILVQLARSGPAKSLAASAQVALRWCAATSDARVWATVYSRLFCTAASLQPEVPPAAASGSAAAAPSWWRICRRRVEAVGLINTLRTPLPSMDGGQRPLHSRVLEGALDPMRGSYDVALASPQTRRVASFVYEHDDEELIGMMQQLGAWENMPVFESACMVASERRMVPLPALEALTGRRIAYFECRFRGGGSIGVLAPGVFQRNSGRMHLGWSSPSFGYHSDDGQFYQNLSPDPSATSYTHKDYGPPYGSGAEGRGGDVIGCALDLDRGSLSFFRNGTHLGRASEDVVAGAGPSAAEEPPAKGEACAYCPAFALHEAGDQADITLGLGGFFSGDVEMRLLTEKALLDQL